MTDKEPWQMTAEEYADYNISSSKYKDSYANNSQLLNFAKAKLKDKWVEELKDRAEVGELPDDVIDDYIRLYGEPAMHSTFRGTKELGISKWTPPESRIYNITYRNYAKNRNADLTQKGQAKATHKAAVQQALSEGKPVPPEVLADYPDLSSGLN